MNEGPSDSLPVRENGRNPTITRDINEDRLLKVSEENVSLKRHLRKQEDRIRQLATKLVRVVGERSKRTQRDDVMLEEQKSRIGELESQVTHLRSKLTVARQQLGSYTKLVPGSTSHGRPKSSRSATGTPTGKIVVPDQVTRLLLDAKGENHLLKDQIRHLQERWNKTNQELMTLKELSTVKEGEYREEIAAVRSQSELGSESKQRKIAENIQFIRLQRDSKRTASWLSTYEAQCRTLEANLNSTTENVSQLELQLSTVQEELRNEQAKSLTLLKLNEENASCLHQLKETNVQLIALKEENKILKEANEACLKKSLESCERMKQTENRENALNSRIQHLEVTVKNELKAKAELISALTQEKAKCLSLEQATQLQDKKYLALLAQLTAGMEELAKHKSNVMEASKPEVIVEKELIVQPCEICPIKDSECAEVQRRADKLKADIVKTKELLKTQISINKEYQEEIEALTSQMAHLEVLHEKERKELMDVFSDKTNKMAELEERLETMRRREPPEIPPPQAFIPYPSIPIVQQQHVHEIIKVQEQTSSDADGGDVLTGDEGIEPSSASVGAEILEADVSGAPELITDSNENEADEGNEESTLTVHIQQFVPVGSDILPRLFITWEHEALPRQYSPIVSDGVFQAESVHQLHERFLKQSVILVHLHQAIGDSDATTLASGTLELGIMQSTIMISVDSEEEIGTLLYSYTLSNSQFEREANCNEESDLPEETPPTAPVPIPRKLKQNHILPPVPTNPIEEEPISEIGNLAESEGEPGTLVEPLTSAQESRIESHIKGKRKSILRRESSPNSPRSDKRRVRVSDNIEERKIDSDSSDGQMDNSNEAEFGQEEQNSYSVGQVLHGEDAVVPPLPTDGNSRSSGQDADSSFEQTLLESEVSEKRRARRMTKRSATEESDEVSTTISAGSEGETSRNISDIETISEDHPTETYSNCDMTIEVIYAKFSKHSHVLSDPRIKKFFVEYQFLDYPPEDLETESSVPKPRSGWKSQFDFRKTFFIDTKEKRRLLKDMVVGNQKLRFTLVTEPGDNDTINCEDIGYAYVSLTEILNSGNDISKKEIPVFDSENPNVEIGSLCVSVIAFKILNAL